jgi:hypothetical protein
MLLMAIPACGDITFALATAAKHPGEEFAFFEAAKWTLALIAWWLLALWAWRWKPKNQ